MPAERKACCDRGHPVQGDRVAVIRDVHGWHDGRLQGVVVHARCAPPRRVSYTVRTDDGEEYFCPKTNDVRKI